MCKSGTFRSGSWADSHLRPNLHRSLLGPLSKKPEPPDRDLRIECQRDAQRLRTPMEKLMKDLHFAIRTLLRAPGFSMVVVISIALGLAANVTVFSIANGLLWGVLPVNDPGRMVMFSEGQSFSYPDYIDYQAQTGTVFEGGIAAHF